VTEVPGSKVVRLKGNPLYNDDRNWLMILPAGEYTLSVTGETNETAEQAQVAIFRPGQSYVVQDIELDAGQEDQFFISEDGTITYRAGDDEAPVLAFGTDVLNGPDSLYRVGLDRLGEGYSFSLNYDHESGKVAFSDDDPDLDAFDLSGYTGDPSNDFACPSFEPGADAITAPTCEETFTLAYTKWEGGQHNLYVADTNGVGERLIYERAASPSWSPDGSTLFFFREGNGIVALNAAPLPGSPDQAQPIERLGQAGVRWTSISPDGKLVAFDSNHGGDYRIYFLDTNENRQLPTEVMGEQPDWSPDGQRLVLRSGRDGISGIWISNLDDSNHANVTQGGSDSFPAWSPDGQTIAFSHDEGGGNWEIYTVNPDGSNLQRLTNAPGQDILPTFTPTGDIIFYSARSGSWGIWKMSRTGGEQTAIIAKADIGPDWAFSRMDVK
jgi:Tol biopolymer transport system component